MFNIHMGLNKQPKFYTERTKIIQARGIRDEWQFETVLTG